MLINLNYLGKLDLVSQNCYDLLHVVTPLILTCYSDYKPEFVNLIMTNILYFSPWQTKSDQDAESKILDTNPSYSSGSSIGTGYSNLTSPPSWPSTTSGDFNFLSTKEVSSFLHTLPLSHSRVNVCPAESNFCEEDDGKEVGRVSRTYQEGFAEPEDTSLSSSQSSYEMGHYVNYFFLLFFLEFKLGLSETNVPTS